MANIKKSTTITKSTSNVGSVVDKTTEVKQYNPTDLISCKSITNGRLLMVGAKTNNVYKWADYDDVESVEYQDLVFDVRSTGNSFSCYPRFIILDDEFVSQNKQLNKVYESVYTTADLRELLSKPANTISDIYHNLPYGIKESLKGLASTMIHSGELDSVSKVKALDNLFGTELLQVLKDS